MDRVLTLHFIDGSKLTFEFPEQAANTTARRLKMGDLMTQKHVVVEADGSVMIFPVANIKYMALSSPLMARKDKAASLPGHAIAGARIVS
jgi:hypothetical protein